MRHEFVERRRWLTDQAFLDLVGATNLIPGPEFHRDGDSHRPSPGRLAGAARRRWLFHPAGGGDRRDPGGDLRPSGHAAGDAGDLLRHQPGRGRHRCRRPGAAGPGGGTGHMARVAGHRRGGGGRRRHARAARARRLWPARRRRRGVAPDPAGRERRRLAAVDARSSAGGGGRVTGPANVADCGRRVVFGGGRHLREAVHRVPEGRRASLRQRIRARSAFLRADLVERLGWLTERNSPTRSRSAR